MKKYIFLFFLFSLSFSLCGQTIVELDKGKAHVRAKNYHDFDLRPTQPVVSDSVRYLRMLNQAYHFMLTDSLQAAEKALKSCLTIRPLAPSNAIVRNHLGDIAFVEQRNTEALDYYTAVLKQLPNDYGTRLKRAEVYIRLKNADAAITDCDVVAPFAQTDSLKTRIHTIKGYAELLRKHYASSIYEWKEALRYDPQNINLPILIAESTYLDGRPAEALKLITAYLEKYPKDENALLLQAELRAAVRQKH